MISDIGQHSAYVWVLLPEQPEPVVCGRVSGRGPGADAIHDFVYGRSYRERREAIPLTPHDLPLEPREMTTRRGLHGVLRDAAPDAWGRRVLIHRLGMRAEQAESELTEIDYLLLSTQTRPGALQFHDNPDQPPQPGVITADLELTSSAVEAVEQGHPLPPDLEAALAHGTSIGGARPKALVQHEGERCIAKFASTTDVHPMVRLEHLALILAEQAGIEPVSSRRTSVLGKDVLLIRRFDTTDTDGIEYRRHFFSALTALELDEMTARYAGYPELADYLRRYGRKPVQACRMLFRRMVFNILIGNTDDHARNHALFWDGRQIELTPAFDLSVIPRVGQEASQAMEVGNQGSRSTLSNALSQCARFGLTADEATELAEELHTVIREGWLDACDQAEIPETDRQRLMGTAVLSPAVLR